MNGTVFVLLVYLALLAGLPLGYLAADLLPPNLNRRRR